MFNTLRKVPLHLLADFLLIGWPYCDPENTFTEADKKEEKGDYDTRVGRNVATEQECIDLVLAKKPKANGMTWVKGGSKDCYAEINAHPGKWSRCGRGCNSCIFKGLLTNSIGMKMSFSSNI